MDNWVPLVAGYGAIAVVVVLIMMFPRTWWARELRRAYEVQRSGPLGRFTAKDQWRSAAVSIVIAVLLIALSLGAYEVAVRLRDSTGPGMLGEFYGFTLFLLGALAIAAGIQSAIRGAKWQLVARRERRISEAFPSEYSIVREILARYDPAELAEFEEPAEYEFQAQRLLALLTKVRTYQDLVAATHLQFQLWFGPRAGPRHRYDPMCHELWHVWQGRSSGT